VRLLRRQPDGGRGAWGAREQVVVQLLLLLLLVMMGMMGMVRMRLFVIIL
jgi:hypothetical protein